MSESETRSPKLAFVLTEPKVPENVGAAARALKTMGFQQLWIVGSDAHEQKQARWLAHGSEEILANVRTFDTLEAVRSAADILIGTTAKPRHGLSDWHEPGPLRAALSNKGESVRQFALVFGREDRGLSNEELAQCDLLTGLPLATIYPSLNLSQAVMLYAWELRELGRAQPAQTGVPAMDRAEYPESGAAGVAGDASWAALRTRLVFLLERIGAANDQKLRVWLLERLGLIGQRDVKMLHTLTGDIEKAIDQRKQP